MPSPENLNSTIRFLIASRSSSIDTKRDELARQDILRRRPAGFGSALGTLGAEFGSSALDPLNAAASFIPVVGEARYAGWLVDAGSAVARAGVRAGVGAAQGVVGTAPIVALQYGLSKTEQGDYSASDALLSLAYGGILGAGLHSIGGAIGDAIKGTPEAVPEAVPPEARALEAAPLATREAVMRTAIAQVSEGRPVEVMPILDMNALRLMSHEASLRNQASQLDEFLAGLDVSPEAPAAADTLARLQVVENQLADPTLAPADRRALMQRRDELLTNTSPETLQETAAPLEIRRQAQAQRSNIGDMLAQIEQQRTAGAASVALSPLPKLQDDPRFAQAARYAAGEALPEDAAISALADRAASHAPDINAEITNLESAVATAQAHGDLPPNLPELDAANAGVARAEAARRGFAQAALCIAKGEL